MTRKATVPVVVGRVSRKRKPLLFSRYSFVTRDRIERSRSAEYPGRTPPVSVNGNCHRPGCLGNPEQSSGQPPSVNGTAKRNQVEPYPAGQRRRMRSCMWQGIGRVPSSFVLHVNELPSG
jgi:hypothetical protein